MITVRPVNLLDFTLLNTLTNTTWNHPLGLMLFENEKLISCVGFSFQDKTVHLHYLFTDKNHREKNYARLLLTYLLQDVLTQNFAQIQVQSSDNFKLFFEGLEFKANEQGQYSLPVSNESIQKLKVALYFSRLPDHERCATSMLFPLHPIRFSDTVYDKWTVLKFFLERKQVPQPFAHLQLDAEQILNFPFDKTALANRLAAYRFANSHPSDAQLNLKQQVLTEINQTSLQYIHNKYPFKFKELQYPVSLALMVIFTNFISYSRSINTLLDWSDIYLSEMNKQISVLNSEFNLSVPQAEFLRINLPRKISSIQLGVKFVALSSGIEMLSHKISFWPHQKDTKSKVLHTATRLFLLLMRIYFMLTIDVGIINTEKQFYAKKMELTGLYNNGTLSDSEFQSYNRAVQSNMFDYLFFITCSMLLNLAMFYSSKDMFYNFFPTKLVDKPGALPPQHLAEQNSVLEKLVGNEPELLADLQQQETLQMKKSL